MPEGTGSAPAEPGERRLQLVVEAAHAGRRLDQALADMLADFSRARLQALMRAGRVQVNGLPCKPRQSAAAGDRVSLHLPAAPDPAPRAQALALRPLYADEHIIVLDKPAGLVVHPGAGNPDGTLMNALLHHFPQLAALPRVGIVHRLDKDTSGVMVVAASERAHRSLVAQLEARDMRREYLAVVRGCPTAGGRVDAPIGRHPRQRTRMAVQAGGRPAISDYRVVERFAHHCALEVRLHTGRTHQIRVHMSHVGLPLVGDPLYAGRPRPAAGLASTLRDWLRDFPRQALHARRLTLCHPASGERLAFEAALPDDMAGLLERLRAGDALRGDP